MFDFTLTATDGKARTGRLSTPHGVVTTPMFMPVGTHGAVKGLLPDELQAIGSQTILANTYHMYLRPGEQLVERLGGLHTFMAWQHPILTDSGGFQVFSLGERGMAGNTKQALRHVSEDGITFHSHLDGSKHLFTPEKSIEVQQALGADIIMAFDQPVYGMSNEGQARVAMERSMRWLVRSQEQWKSGRDDQALFGIVQGGTYRNLHRTSAEAVATLGLLGNALGGLSVGEGKPEMWAAVESINEILPNEKPRYFMGLGEPRDLVDAVLRGVDMFDCVSPTRLARHGAVWMPVGDELAVRAFWDGDTEGWLKSESVLTFERWNLKSAKFRDDSRPLCEGDAFSRAVLRHYVIENEMIGFRCLSKHNVSLLHMVVMHLRNAIITRSVLTLSKLISS